MTQKVPLYLRVVFSVVFAHVKKLEYQKHRRFAWGGQVWVSSRESRTVYVGLRSLGKPEPGPHTKPGKVPFKHPSLELASILP